MNVLTLLKREFLLHGRQLRFLFQFMLFFILLMLSFPMTMPHHTPMLAHIFPAMLWLGVLLSMLLSCESMFLHEVEQGVLTQWFLTGHSLTVIIFIKMLAQWLMLIVALIILSPIFAFLYQLSCYQWLYSLLLLIAGTPALMALTTIAAAFGQCMGQRGVMLTLIIMPLALPILIFGGSATSMMINGQNILGQLALLTAISITCVTLLPFAASMILAMALD